MTGEARAATEKKAFGHRSYRVSPRLQSLPYTEPDRGITSDANGRLETVRFW